MQPPCKGPFTCGDDNAPCYGQIRTLADKFSAACTWIAKRKELLVRVTVFGGRREFWTHSRILDSILRDPRRSLERNQVRISFRALTERARILR